MLSGVLRSPEAVAVNVAIMRAFVRLRHVLQGQESLLRRLDDLEARVGAHDAHLRAVFRAIRQLIEGPPVPERRRIGFEEDRRPGGTGRGRSEAWDWAGPPNSAID